MLRAGLAAVLVAGLLPAAAVAGAPPESVTPRAGEDVQAADQLTFVVRTARALDPSLALEVATAPALGPDGTLADGAVISRPAPYGVRDLFVREAFTGPFEALSRTPGTYYWQPSTQSCVGEACTLEPGEVRRFRVVPVAPPEPVAPADGATVIAPDADGARRVTFAARGAAAQAASVTFELSRTHEADARGRFRDPFAQPVSTRDDGRYEATVSEVPVGRTYWHVVSPDGVAGRMQVLDVARFRTLVRVGPVGAMTLDEDGRFAVPVRCFPAPCRLRARAAPVVVRGGRRRVIAARASFAEQVAREGTATLRFRVHAGLARRLRAGPVSFSVLAVAESTEGASEVERATTRGEHALAVSVRAPARLRSPGLGAVERAMVRRLRRVERGEAARAAQAFCGRLGRPAFTCLLTTRDLRGERLDGSALVTRRARGQLRFDVLELEPADGADIRRDGLRRPASADGPSARLSR